MVNFKIDAFHQNKIRNIILQVIQSSLRSCILKSDTFHSLQYWAQHKISSFFFASPLCALNHLWFSHVEVRITMVPLNFMFSRKRRRRRRPPLSSPVALWGMLLLLQKMRITEESSRLLRLMLMLRLLCASFHYLCGVKCWHIKGFIALPTAAVAAKSSGSKIEKILNPLQHKLDGYAFCTLLWQQTWKKSKGHKKLFWSHPKINY